MQFIETFGNIEEIIPSKSDILTISRNAELWKDDFNYVFNNYLEFVYTFANLYT